MNLSEGKLSLLLNGGETTKERIIVELVYLAAAAALGAVAQFVISSPELFPGQWVVVARLLLGFLANFANPAVENS